MRSLIILGALALIAGCQRPRGGGTTPSGLSDAGLTSSKSSQEVRVDPPSDLSLGCGPGRYDLTHWKRIDPSTVPPGRARALNDAQCTWSVLIQNDVVVAVEYRALDLDVSPEFILPKIGAPHVARRGHAGLLLGYNRGEWGGALRWYTSDRRFEQQLLDDNIVDILPTPHGFLAIASVLESDTGRATELIDTGTVYRLGKSALIGGFPLAVVAEPDGTFLVATLGGLVRITRDLEMQRLFGTNWLLHHPTSIVIKGGRFVYLGMQGIVAAIDLEAKPPTETWLSPIDLH